MRVRRRIGTESLGRGVGHDDGCPVAASSGISRRRPAERASEQEELCRTVEEGV